MLQLKRIRGTRGHRNVLWDVRLLLQHSAWMDGLSFFVLILSIFFLHFVHYKKEVASMLFPINLLCLILMIVYAY